MFLYVVLPWLVFLGAAALFWALRARAGWQVTTYALVTIAVGATGLTLLGLAPRLTILWNAGAVGLVLCGISLFLGVVEYGLLAILGQFRLGAITRVTYYEALLQPFTIIVICAGFAAMAVAGGLEYFTYNEDFKMFRDVASSFVFLFSLPIMVFASTKVVDEEIENRTMLTLMSKPVSRWQVILGKYLGVFLLVLVAVVALGSVAAITGYIRYFDDMAIDYRVAIGDPAQIKALDLDNLKAFMALLPSLALTLLQLATLAAISVAVSTRYGLAVNVTVVVLIYVAANIMGFAQNTQDLPLPVRMIATLLSWVLPGLSVLDLNQRLVFGNYALSKNDTYYLTTPGVIPSYAQIWQYVGLSAVYALFYIGAALSLGMALFRSRELT